MRYPKLRDTLSFRVTYKQMRAIERIAVEEDLPISAIARSFLKSGMRAAGIEL